MGKFAFGGDMVSGIECPAVQAGCDPTDEELAEFITVFDGQMEKRADTKHGVVSEDEAAEVWLETLRLCDSPEAWRVAEELGWR